MTISTALDEVRLEIGDRDMDSPLFTDDEITYFLDRRSGNVLEASADACDSLAVRFASGIDFTTDTLAIKKLDRSEVMAKRAVTLRERAAGGIAEVGQTRVDGYSQNLDNTSTELITSAPVDPDIPRYGPSWESDLARQIGYKPGNK
jgi:hypothetical protein